MANTPEQTRVLEDIRKYGCHVIQARAHGAEPAYAYTVGIGRTSDAPDVVVVGQPAPASHRLLHAYNLRVRRGERFELGHLADGFLKGQPVAFRPVDVSHHRPRFAWNYWLNGGPGFQMLQMVYPSREGIWPWDPMADGFLRQLQPLLEQPANG